MALYHEKYHVWTTPLAAARFDASGFDLSALSYAIQCEPECAELRKNPVYFYECQSTTARSALRTQGMSAKQGSWPPTATIPLPPVRTLHEIGDAIAAVQIVDNCNDTRYILP